ncbi:MAG: hypothetical protein HY551_02665 [Elusimicrobia bacterium]|nr:hypothetical protein [Elusimicrobiota bacterium]
MEIRSADMPALLLGPGKHRIACRPGQTVTLLSIPPKSIVTTSGLMYPLAKDVLPRSSRGLSNRATANTVGIHIHFGRLWAITDP